MNFTISPLILIFFIFISIFLFIFKISFKLNFSVFKISFLLFILFLTYKMLCNFYPFIEIKNIAFFENKKFSNTNYKSHYIIIFGKSELDLSNIKFYSNIEKIKITNIVGKITLKYPENYPIKLTIKNIFSYTKLPLSEMYANGEKIIKTAILNEKRKFISTKLTNIFSHTIIIKKKAG